MLGRLLLILFQFVVGWYASLEIAKAMPDVGNLNIFLMAAIFAVLVWAIGLLAAAVFKGVPTPSPSTLLFALAFAVLLSTVSALPDAHKSVVALLGSFDVRLYPLIGAVVGYAVQN